MVVGLVNGGDSKSFIIERAVSGLICEMVVDVDATHTPISFLNTYLGDALITLELLSTSGERKMLVNKMPIIDIMEFSQSKEGFISLTGTLSNTNTATVKGLIPVGLFGSVPFDSDISLEVTISAGNSNISTISLRTVDSLEYSYHYNKFTKLQVLTGVKDKDFDLKSFSTILIPVSALTTSTVFNLVGSNNKTLKLSKDDLIDMANLSNDICYHGDSNSIYGVGRNIILNVSKFTELRMTRDTVTSFDMFVHSFIVASKLGISEKYNENLRVTF